MAPPRLKCVNATGQVVKTGLQARASFSSSAVVKADDPPRRNATSQLLSSLTPARDSRNTSFNLPNTPSSSRRDQPTGFKLPVGGARISGTDRISNLIRENEGRRARSEVQRSRMSTAEEIEERTRALDMTKQITRRWKTGDVYAPHDLTGVEMEKWKKRKAPDRDVFDLLKLDPLDNYSNFSIMSEFMTSMGRIQSGRETGLRAVNQRKVAKAIRRSIGMGLMPSVHRHPELLYKDAERIQYAANKGFQGPRR